MPLPSPSRSSFRSTSPTPTLVDPDPSSSARASHLHPSSAASISSKNTPYKASAKSTGSNPRLASAASSSTTLSSRHSRQSRQSRHSAQTLDSIWDFNFEEHWERRQRDDAVRLAELKGTVPYLTFGRYEEEILDRPHEHGQEQGHEQGQEQGHAHEHEQEHAHEHGHGHGHHVGFQEGAHDQQERMAHSPSELGRIEEAEAEVLGLEKRGGPLALIDNNRRALRKVMRMKRFHLIMISLVAFDLVIVMIELIVSLLTAGCMTEQIYELVLESIERAHSDLTPAMFACSLAPTASRDQLEDAIFGINVTLLCIFTLDVLFAIYAFGPITYVTSWVTLLDGFVVIATLCLDVYFHLSTDPAAKMMEAAEKGREKLEWERIAESIRLNFMRQTLITETGQDIEPHVVEAHVQHELRELERKQAEEEERLAQELRQGGIWRCRSRHGGI
ncbi:hypothetical protein JCM5296_002798 [Sporobolomyces johnsonii]